MSVFASADWASIERMVANHLWQSTVLAGVAALLALSLWQNHARTRHWIWVAASLKFLVPFSAIIAIGGWFGEPLAPRVASPRIPILAGQIAQPFALPDTVFPFAAAPTRRRSNPLPGAIVAVWFWGFAAILVKWQLKWRRVARIVDASAPLSGGREMEALRRVQGGGAPLRLVASAAKLEPGIFGIFRQVIWLPNGIGDYLSDAQLEAILAHELCHARRRDNLLAAIHMVVEAMFWFHPLVWWLGTRLEEERERACDEEVLRLVGDARAYAEGVLMVCEFYLTSPLACAAGVTGADLRKRVEGIMANRFVCGLSFGKKALLAGAGLLAIAGPIAVGLMVPPRSVAQSPAQSGETDLQFEVASIKHSDPNRIGSSVPPRTSSPGLFRTEFITLKGLAMRAYDLKQGFEIDWKPSWMGTELYDVEAKVPAGATKAQIRIMLQRLLADRFGLVVHRETRQLPGYRLIVAKGGPRLKQSAAAPAKTDDAAHEPAPPQNGVVVKNGIPQLSDSAGTGEFMTLAGTILRGRHESVEGLAYWLALKLNAPVVNATGLAGEYDYDLSFQNVRATRTKDSVAFGPGGVVVLPANAGPAVTPEVSAEPSGRPTIWEAIKEQLGLQLDAFKSVPVEVLVLDKAHQPTEN
jgi:bla regulator protein BlaR1